MQRIKQSVALVLAGQLAVVFLAGDARALEKCKVRVDKKTGVIRVDASSVSGALQWGDAAGQETNPVFNPACLLGGRARKCELADPATVESKTPPAGCTIHMADAVCFVANSRDLSCSLRVTPTAPQSCVLESPL